MHARLSRKSKTLRLRITRTRYDFILSSPTFPLLTLFGLQRLKKLTAAIVRNIEKQTTACLSRNGGKLALLKKVNEAAKKGGDELSSKATVPKFDTRKQFRLTS